MAGVEAQHGTDQAAVEAHLVAAVENTTTAQFDEPDEPDTVDTGTRLHLRVVGREQFVHLSFTHAPARERFKGHPAVGAPVHEHLHHHPAHHPLRPVLGRVHRPHPTPDPVRAYTSSTSSSTASPSASPGTPAAMVNTKSASTPTYSCHSEPLNAG